MYSTSRHKRVFAGALALLAMAHAAALRAQQPTLPDSVCTAVQALARESPERALWSRNLSRCGTEAIALAARLIEQAATHTDTAYLNAALVGADRPSPMLLRAGANLFQNPAASLPARVTGLLVLVRQAFGEPSFFLVGVPLDRLQDYTPCVFYDQAGPHVLDGAAEVRRIAKRVADDLTEPEPVRALGVCVMRRFVPGYQPAVDLSRITISHVCLTQFRIRNDLDVPVLLKWRVTGATAHGLIKVNSRQETLEFTFAQGATQFLHNDHLITTLASSSKPCP